MHFTVVLKDSDRLHHRPLITHNSTCFSKIPPMLKAIAAKMTLPESVIKWLAAGRAERCLNQADTLHTCVTIGNVPAPFQGAAIGLITAGLMSLAFMGLGGLVKV